MKKIFGNTNLIYPSFWNANRQENLSNMLNFVQKGTSQLRGAFAWKKIFPRVEWGGALLSQFEGVLETFNFRAGIGCGPETHIILNAINSPCLNVSFFVKLGSSFDALVNVNPLPTPPNLGEMWSIEGS